MSENPFGMKPIRNLFIARNRIIAGLSDVTIVVESADKGGALVTADFANNYNREVFAVPGSLANKYASGCHKL
ncbi:DNA-processing protein DprA, partial [Klebsiella pneumoniae]|uniref:DNA-processing protein DprA n=1 Tax=Klebsiella pneumoniae TaxID=573 RepID=UPI0027306AE6